MRKTGYSLGKWRSGIISLIAQRDLSLLVAARTAFLTAVLLSLSVYSIRYGNDLDYLFLPLIILFAICACSGLWLMSRKAGQFFTFIQLGIDITAITGVIYITGGTSSPFLFLYLPAVMAAAILSSRNTALGVVVIASIAYGSMCLALYKSWILNADGTAVEDFSLAAALLQLFGLCSAMFLVAVLSSFLVKKAALQQMLANLAQENLSVVTKQQQNMIDNFPEGIVSTNLELCVSQVNEAAKTLLMLKDSVELLHFPTLLADKCDHVPNESLLIKQTNEIQLLSNDHLGTNSNRIRLVPKSIFNNSGLVAGYIFVLQDVTQLRSVEEQLEMQERMARLLAAKDQQTESSDPLSFNQFVGESVLMQKVFKLIQRVAASEATVLIYGESGTGKELVARAVHNGSSHSGGPFVALNCGAIPENLIESELFGHKKGSFTGADSESIGMFRQAEGGTLFLDEIGELPLLMQAKLLRALQEKKVRPVGGDRDIAINVRIIAATNRNLKTEISHGNFREDLFYRLNVICINLPALRERKEDIPLLVHQTFKRLVKAPKTHPTVSPAAMQLLLDYNYPGNVRELENVLERALVLGGEVILPEHLPDSVKNYAALRTSESRPQTELIIDENIELPIDLDKLLATIERRYLEIALQKTNGIKKHAAEVLGMNFRSFRYRLQKFGMQADDDLGNMQ